MSKSKVYYNKVYQDTLDMYRELKTISGTAACTTLYGTYTEVTMFPLIIEYIADVESTLKRLKHLPKHQVGVEFERLQLYPFSDYSKKLKRNLIKDYVAPIDYGKEARSITPRQSDTKTKQKI